MRQSHRSVMMIFTLLSVFSTLPSPLSSIPAGFNVQGRLTDANGVNREGEYPVRFTICSDDQCALSDSRLWWKTLSIPVRNGNFQVVLEDPPEGGKVTSLSDAVSGSQTFLEIKVGNEDPLVPRQRLVSVPFAMRAAMADSLSVPMIPIGTILMHAAEAPPPGFLECNGDRVSRTTEAGLFAIIGERFGRGDGSTNFNLPDLRGMFVRGWNHNATNDPDATVRTSLNDGGVTGNRVGSYQTDAFQGHWHNWKYSVSNEFFAAPTGNWSVGAPHSYSPPGTDSDWTRDPISDGAHGPPRISNETRPENVYLMFIIKR